MNALELARWRGGVDSTLADHERRLSALNGHLAANADALNAMQVEMATMRTKVATMAAVAAGIASIVGSTVAALVVSWAT